MNQPLDLTEAISAAVEAMYDDIGRRRPDFISASVHAVTQVIERQVRDRIVADIANSPIPSGASPYWIRTKDISIARGEP